MGIEPTSEAWEASILPLYDARSLNKVAKAETGRKRLVGILGTHGGNGDDSKTARSAALQRGRGLT